MLDNFTLYWLTNSATSAARLYWENREQSLISAGSLKTDKISVPVAVSIFPTRSIARRRHGRGGRYPT